MFSSGSSFPPQLGIFLLVFGLVYFLILAGTIAIGVLALIAWWRASAAHQSLAQSVKQLADKLALAPEPLASGREPAAEPGEQPGR